MRVFNTGDHVRIVNTFRKTLMGVVLTSDIVPNIHLVGYHCPADVFSNSGYFSGDKLIRICKGRGK